MTDVKIKGLGLELDEICKMFYEKTEPIELCDPGEWRDYGIFGKLNLLKKMIGDMWTLESKLASLTEEIEKLRSGQRFVSGWSPESFRRLTESRKRTEELERALYEIQEKIKGLSIEPKSKVWNPDTGKSDTVKTESCGLMKGDMGMWRFPVPKTVTGKSGDGQ